ncbi:hypothetical protein [Chondromyces crocatus]|uniref:Uncharacterized protein n=1 Tax=Chondromyces crocatus TaxID=52 RepID=A0A0K1EJH7_CHOCO|nr:hypothetical protein [Chondromyces crocatus]AKT41015.1 uncharacterized protein CMC5_051730 [Chondromyces crocatus]
MFKAGDSATTIQEHLNGLVERLCNDPTFRSAFWKDPVKTAAKAGFDVPEPLVRQLASADGRVVDVLSSRGDTPSSSARKQSRLVAALLLTSGVRGSDRQN